MSSQIHVARKKIFYSVAIPSDEGTHLMDGLIWAKRNGKTVASAPMVDSLIHGPGHGGIFQALPCATSTLVLAVPNDTLFSKFLESEPIDGIYHVRNKISSKLIPGGGGLFLLFPVPDSYKHEANAAIVIDGKNYELGISGKLLLIRPDSEKNIKLVRSIPSEDANINLRYQTDQFGFGIPCGEPVLENTKGVRGMKRVGMYVGPVILDGGDNKDHVLLDSTSSGKPMRLGLVIKSHEEAPEAPEEKNAPEVGRQSIRQADAPATAGDTYNQQRALSRQSPEQTKAPAPAAGVGTGAKEGEKGEAPEEPKPEKEPAKPVKKEVSKICDLKAGRELSREEVNNLPAHAPDTVRLESILSIYGTKELIASLEAFFKNPLIAKGIKLKASDTGELLVVTAPIEKLDAVEILLSEYLANPEKK